MTRSIASILPCVFAIAASAEAQLSREKLDELIRQKVTPSLIVQLIERDCVSFSIDADTLIAMRQYPPEVVQAAINCKRVPPVDSPQASSAPALLRIHIERHGEGSDQGPWGIFVPYAYSAGGPWEGESRGQGDADVDIGVLFTAATGDPQTILTTVLSQSEPPGRFVGGCRKDTYTSTRPSIQVYKTTKIFGCFWHASNDVIELSLPAGEHTVRAITFLKVIDRGWRLGNDWVRIDPVYSGLRQTCPTHTYEAATKIILVGGEARDLTFRIGTDAVKSGGATELCCTMSLR